MIVVSYARRHAKPRVTVGRERLMAMTTSLWSDFNALVLVVTDLAESKRFYLEQLGFAYVGPDPDAETFSLGDTMVILLRADSAQAQFKGKPVSTPFASGAQTQLCAFVPDVDSAAERLKGRGVVFLHDPEDQPWGRRTALFCDPDGHIWEISSLIST